MKALSELNSYRSWFLSQQVEFLNVLGCLKVREGGVSFLEQQAKLRGSLKVS